jgi:hypothetical protein
MRPHSSHELSPYVGPRVGAGVSIQCQVCSGQGFRRSRLRAEDFKQIFMMRYPVRCLRCGQRQMVSFTVAGISVPSHVKQRQARKLSNQQKFWAEPVKESLRPKDTRGPKLSESEEAKVAGEKSGS